MWKLVAWFIRRFTAATGAASSPASSIIFCTANRCRARCGKMRTRRQLTFRSLTQTVVGPRADTHFPLSSTASKYFIKRTNQSISICFREWHWWSDLDHVVKWSFCSHQYAALAHLIYDTVCIPLELNSKKKSGTADFADHFVTRIQFVQAGE